MLLHPQFAIERMQAAGHPASGEEASMRNRLVGEAQCNIHERFVLDVCQARLVVRCLRIGAMHIAGDDTLLLDEDAAYRMYKLVDTGALQEVAIDGLRGNETKGLAHARFISELSPEDDLY